MDWAGLIKSTRFQAGIAAIAFAIGGERLGVSEQQILIVVGIVCTFMISRSIRSGKPE